MSAWAATTWCRACGMDAGWANTPCGRCGVPLEQPAPGTARVGRVISVKGRLLRRNGIAVGEAGEIVRILVRASETVEMPTLEFDTANDIAVPGPPVGGAAGRLWKAYRAQLAGAIDAKWDQEPIMDAALAQAAASTGTRRGAALDALSLGAPELLSALGLTATERAWYQARAAAAIGDTRTLLGWLELLPAEGYAPRVALLLARVADLLRDPALGARAVRLLAPFTGTDLDARALHAALAAPGTADVLAPLKPLAEATVSGADRRLSSWAAAITGLTLPAEPFPDGLPAASALTGYLRFRDGGEAAATVEALRMLPVTLLDELIDGDGVPSELLGRPGWPAGTATYVRCRLTPGEASTDDLAQAGFTAELARRHYLADELAALDALPADDEAVRHYRALAAWRSGTGRPGLDGLRPAARLVLGRVAETQAAVATGEDTVLPEELAGDPSCWPLLWSSALQGTLRLTGSLAARYPRFAEWLALCGIQRLLFQSRWEDALDAALALALRTGLEVTSDEALNMAAFAQFQLGQPASALRTLDDALGGRYTIGLLANASIVAASQGSVAALPYLTKITRVERDAAVRSGSVDRAIELWKQDDESPEYPDELRVMVREALAQPQADALHRTMVSLADTQDTAWLAGTSQVHSANPAQADWLRYRRAWARAKSDEFSGDLEDVAKVLAAVVKQPSPPEWAKPELRSFARQLDEAVHVSFGEAIGLATVIEVLVDAKVLELNEELTLAAQAVAHIAFYLNEQDGCVKPEYEQRMLFDMVRQYGARRAELAEGDRAWAGKELAKCAVVTARAVALGLMRDWDEATNRFNNLVDQQRYAVDYELQRIYRQKRDIVQDELKPLRARLAGYLPLLDDLPLNDEQRELRDLISTISTDWGQEINGTGSL